MAHQSHIADLFVELEGRMPFERFMQEGKLDIDGRFEDAEKKKRSSTPKG